MEPVLRNHQVNSIDISQLVASLPHRRRTSVLISVPHKWFCNSAQRCGLIEDQSGI